MNLRSTVYDSVGAIFTGAFIAEQSNLPGIK